jgi:hypothetical protein
MTVRLKDKAMTVRLKDKAMTVRLKNLQQDSLVSANFSLVINMMRSLDFLVMTTLGSLGSLW